MEFTNEYKFDTAVNREFLVWHISDLCKQGYTVVAVEDDEGTKILVTFLKPMTES